MTTFGTEQTQAAPIRARRAAAAAAAGTLLAAGGFAAAALPAGGRAPAPQFFLAPSPTTPASVPAPATQVRVQAPGTAGATKEGR